MKNDCACARFERFVPRGPRYPTLVLFQLQKDLWLFEIKTKDKSKFRKARAHRSFASFIASNEDLPTCEDDASLDDGEDLDPPVYASMSNLCAFVYGHKKMSVASPTS